MGLSNIIDVVISIQTAKSLGKGFGVPLIVSHSATWQERTRTYTTPAGVASDFAQTTPEYRAANQMFSQDPRPPTIKIGRAAVTPTMHWTLVATVQNNTVYQMTVVDEAGTAHLVSYTSGGSATANAIIGGLKTAIDALSLDLTTVNVSSGASLTIAANDVGDYFGIAVGDIGLLSLVQDEADPSTGIAAELTAINTQDPAWYALNTLFNSTAIVTAAAAWVESNEKLYVATSQESAVATHAVSGATDIAHVQSAAAHARTGVLYHGLNSEFADSAWLGACLPFVSGSETWKFKTLVGVTPEDQLCANWSQTYYVNITGKNANLYETVAQVAITENGTVADGEFLDVIRFRDWLASDMATRIYNLLLEQPKVPFTDAGIAQILAEVRASLKAGVATGGLSNNPKPSAAAPLAADASPTDKATRNLEGVTFSAVLAGAVHAVNPLNGVITV